MTVSDLELRLPVLEQPGSLGGLVQARPRRSSPPGYQLAHDYQAGGGSAGGGSGGAPIIGVGVTGLARGRIIATPKALLVRLHCAGAATCTGNLSISLAAMTAAGARPVLASGAYSIPSRQTRRLALPLSRAGHRIVAGHRGRRTTVRAHLDFNDSGRPTLFELTRPVHFK